VGKVVYNKRELPKATDTPPPQPPSYFPQHARLKVSEVDIESLLNELGTDIQTFVAALHENYVLSCGGMTAEDTLDTVNGCMDSLSDSDILCPDRFTSGIRRGIQGTGLDALRQDEISFQICVRGLLFNLPHPVKRVAPPTMGRGAAYRMFYPKSLQLWRRREEIEESLEKIIGRLHQEADQSIATNVSQAAPSGGVETWAKTSKTSNIFSTQNKDLAAGEDNHISRATILIALGMSNKFEILLEWLPFTACIRRSKIGSNRDQFLKDIETVTHVKGSAANQAGDEDQQDAEAETTPDDIWSTDKPAEESVQAYGRSRIGIQLKADIEAVVQKEKVHPLVLSDDDIEDD
jgi:cell cycle checkpoint protein